MGDVSEVKRMLELVAKYDLVGRSIVEGFAPDELAQIYNGIGPEWFSPVVRRALDRLHDDLLPVAFVHDVDYATGNGTAKDFRAANDRFAANGCIVADAKYGWYDPRRYLRRHQAHLFARLCQDFGWPAYEAAVKDFSMRHGADWGIKNTGN